VTVALLVGALVLAVAAPLYLVARRTPAPARYLDRVQLDA